MRSDLSQTKCDLAAESMSNSSSIFGSSLWFYPGERTRPRVLASAPRAREISFSVAQIARESVDQVVLAAVRFIGDDDDVATLG